MDKGLDKKLIIKSPKDVLQFYVVKKQYELNIKSLFEDLFEAYFFRKYTKSLPKFFILILEYGLFDEDIRSIKEKTDLIFQNRGGIYKDYNARIYANFDGIKIITHNNYVVHSFSKRSKYSCVVIQKDMGDFMKLNLITGETDYFLILDRSSFDEIKMMIS